MKTHGTRFNENTSNHVQNIFLARIEMILYFIVQKVCMHKYVQSDSCLPLQFGLYAVIFSYIREFEKQ